MKGKDVSCEAHALPEIRKPPKISLICLQQSNGIHYKYESSIRWGVSEKIGLLATGDNQAMKPKKLFLVLTVLFSALAGTLHAQTGPLGNALSFNGVNQYVSVPNFGNIAPTNEVTVEFWAKAGAIAQQSAFMLNPDETTNRFNCHISYNDGDTYWDFGNINTSGRVNAPNPPNTVGYWVHYALVASYSGNYMVIYTNGNLFATNAGMTPFVRGSYELRIGGNISYFFNGQLDDFRVWNVARTQAQIQSDLDTPLTGNEANLLLYYKFDSSSGTVATNSAIATGAAYNGFLVHGPTWVASGAAGTVVTTNADSGLGSLRWAVSNAVPGTTVTFAPGLSGQTILLTSGEILLTTNLTIDASALAGGIQINGNHTSRIFEIASGTTVTFNSLTLTNSYAKQGGAILQDGSGTLALIHCTLLNNMAHPGDGGAISLTDGGDYLALTNCLLSGNSATYGGAITTYASTLTMVQCTLSNNTSQDGGAVCDYDNSWYNFTQCLFVGNSATDPVAGGGAIQNWGDLTLTACVLSNNSAIGDGDGGAIYCDGPSFMTNCIISSNSAAGGGGGVICGSTICVNCTFAGNWAGVDNDDGGGGGAINPGPNSSFTQCTFFGNYCPSGGALCLFDVRSTLLTQCTIVSNSAADPSGGIYYGVTTILATNCIITGNTPGNIYLPSYYSGSFTGINSLTNGDPMLAPLGNYGGLTQTMPPLPGSPAIDAGVPTTLTTDQRGYPRVIGPAPDLGAAEFFYSGPAVVTTAADSGPGSLRYIADHSMPACYQISDNLAAGTVTFAPALTGQTILLMNGQITLGSSMTIDASALPAGIQINGNNASRIFDVMNVVPGFQEEPPSVSLNSLTLTNGNSSQGGAIYADYASVLTLQNCALTGNSAPGSQGGAIFCYDPYQVTLNQCTLAGNSAPNGGGAIFNAYDGIVSLNECTLWGNSAADGTGGAIYNGMENNFGSSLSLDQCTVSGNSAANGSGGGIFNDDADGDYTSMYNSIVSSNTPIDFAGSFSETPNLVGGNALLAPLGNYGGPTQTMPPLPGSPAVDAAATSDFTTDQRGFPRVLGPAPDLGAVEGIFNPAGPGLLTAVPQLENGAFQFGFTNYEGMTQTILTTTNLALPSGQWTILGTAVETPAGSGNFQFADLQATNNPQRFYRVRSP